MWMHWLKIFMGSFMKIDVLRTDVSKVYRGKAEQIDICPALPLIVSCALSHVFLRYFTLHLL